MPTATPIAFIHRQFEAGRDQHLMLCYTQGFAFGIIATFSLAGLATVRDFVQRRVIFTWHCLNSLYPYANIK